MKATTYKDPQKVMIEELCETIWIKQATVDGVIAMDNGGVANLGFPTSKTRRGRVVDVGRICPTITTQDNAGGLMQVSVDSNKKYRIRRLTPRECWRLMNFTDEQFDKAKTAGLSDTQLYKQAGNSIVVGVLEQIMGNLYDAIPYLFDDLKVSSYFSGIGAFESALDRVYEKNS